MDKTVMHHFSSPLPRVGLSLAPLCTLFRFYAHTQTE